MPTYAASDGTTMTYRRLGRGEPLLCLPGGPLRDPVYLGDLGGLAAHRELIVPELRRDRIDRLVADLEALREELGLERLDLVAHSAGGNLALLYATAHPDRIGRLALVTPGTRVVGLEVSDEEWDAVMESRATEPWYPAATVALDALFEGEDTAENQLAAAPLWYGVWNEETAEHASGEADERWHAGTAVHYAEGAFDSAATVTALSTLTAPTLILAGDLDPMLTPACARELAALLPGATVEVLDGCGHYPWVEYPELFVKVAAGFLSGEAA